MKEHFGYTEPFRRFVQHETFSPQANEIPNTAASWLPGDDYYVNFHEGDPFIKVDEGYARLPGEGYAALHPELKDINQGETSFFLKRHLGNPLPLMCGMLLYIHIYESFAESTFRQQQIAVPALVQARLTYPKTAPLDSILFRKALKTDPSDSRLDSETVPSESRLSYLLSSIPAMGFLLAPSTIRIRHLFYIQRVEC